MQLHIAEDGTEKKTLNTHTKTKVICELENSSLASFSAFRVSILITPILITHIRGLITPVITTLKP